MNSDEILAQCTAIFIDQFANSSIVLKRETTAADIDEWDSLTHLQIIVAIEKHFKIRFTASEIQKFKSVGDMCDIIASKMSA